MTRNISVNKIATLAGHSGSIYALECSGEELWLSGGGDGIVVEWSMINPNQGVIIARTPGVIYSLLIIGEKLLVGQASGAIHVIDLKHRKEERLLKYHDTGVFKLIHVPQHKLIFSLAGDGVLGVMDADSLTLLKKLSLGNGKLRAAAVNTQKNILAVGAGDGSIYTFSLPDLHALHHWQAHQQGFSVNAVQFSADGKQLLSGSRDAHLNVFDVTKDFDLIHSIPAHNYAIYSIEYSPDEKLFATGSRDKTVKIWDAETFEVLHRIDKEKSDGHANSVNTILWLLKSGSEIRPLAGAGSGDPARQQSGSEIRPLAGAGSGDPARQYAGAGEHAYYLISGSDDRSVMVWGIK